MVFKLIVACILVMIEAYLLGQHCVWHSDFQALLPR